MRTIEGVSIVGLALAIAVQATAATLPNSCGPNDTSFNIHRQKTNAASASSAGKATLVFVQRTGACIGCSTTRVGLDGAWVGANKGSSYFAVPVEPGEHHVCADWGAPLARLEARVGLTNLQTEAGKTYYFETEIVVPVANADIGAGGAPRMNLKPLSDDMGAFLVSRSEQSVAVPKSK